MISRFFITRPIFACVISAFIVIAGLAGIRALPISAYPNIIPPQVTITVQYPGATAETTDSGSIVRLKDVARVELGAQTYNFSSMVGGKPAVLTAIFLQPGANALETGSAIKQRLEELSVVTRPVIAIVLALT